MSITAEECKVDTSQETFPDLIGYTLQFLQRSKTEAPGVAERESIPLTTETVLDPERHCSLSPVTLGLIFLCCVIDGLYDALSAAGDIKRYCL